MVKREKRKLRSARTGYHDIPSGVRIRDGFPCAVGKITARSPSQEKPYQDGRDQRRDESVVGGDDGYGPPVDDNGERVYPG